MTRFQRNAAVILLTIAVVVAIFAMTTVHPPEAYRIYAGGDMYSGRVTERSGTHVIHTTDGRTIEYQGPIVMVRED